MRDWLQRRARQSLALQGCASKKSPLELILGEIKGPNLVLAQLEAFESLKQKYHQLAGFNLKTAIQDGQ